MRFEELYGLNVLRMILVMRYFKSFLIIYDLELYDDF